MEMPVFNNIFLEENNYFHFSEERNQLCFANNLGWADDETILMFISMSTDHFPHLLITIVSPWSIQSQADGGNCRKGLQRSLSQGTFTGSDGQPSPHQCRDNLCAWSFACPVASSQAATPFRAKVLPPGRRDTLLHTISTLLRTTISPLQRKPSPSPLGLRLPLVRIPVICACAIWGMCWRVVRLHWDYREVLNSAEFVQPPIRELGFSPDCARGRLWLTTTAVLLMTAAHCTIKCFRQAAHCHHLRCDTSSVFREVVSEAAASLWFGPRLMVDKCQTALLLGVNAYWF